MELQATSFDVEEVIECPPFEGLASFGHRQAPGQRWLAGGTDRALIEKRRSGGEGRLTTASTHSNRGVPNCVIWPDISCIFAGLGMVSNPAPDKPES